VSAPDGYIIASNTFEFVIDATGTPVITWVDEQPDNALDLSETSKENDTITVTNKAGHELPMTGGIGTTIFYILGSVLVLGCGVVLVAHKIVGIRK
jgi:LPXTG-motif cell wall-anchored protein